MSQPIVPIVTQAGLTAAFNAEQNGLQLDITHIALGAGQWTPDATATALVDEQQRVPVTAGQVIPPNQLHVSALVDGPQAYWVNEFAIIADGVVLAVWSDPVTPLAYKAENISIVFSHDLILHAFPPGSITVSNLTTDLNLTVLEPIAELATAAVATQHRELHNLFERLDLQTRLAALEAATA